MSCVHQYDHLRRPLLERMPPMEVSRTSSTETNGEMEEVTPDPIETVAVDTQDSVSPI